MKTILLLIFVFASELAAAQHTSLFDNDDAPNRIFYGGLTLGANFTQVDGDGFSGYHRVGIHAGPLVYVRMSSTLYLSFELLYDQKGSKWRDITDIAAAGYDLKLTYAEVPLVLHYTFRPKTAVGLGVSYARLISSDESAYENVPVNLYPDINYFKKQDWCYLAEASYEPVRGWLAVFRYAYSIASIREGDRIPQGYGGGTFAGQYNNLFTVRLIYFFRGRERG